MEKVYPNTVEGMKENIQKWNKIAGIKLFKDFHIAYMEIMWFQLSSATMTMNDNVFNPCASYINK